jgi:hypothetical protein
VFNNGKTEMLQRIITQLSLPQDTTEDQALAQIKCLNDQATLARQREAAEVRLADLIRVTGMSRAEALANLEHKRVGAEQNAAVEAGRVAEKQAVLERGLKRARVAAATYAAHVKAHPEAAEAV